MSVSEMPRSRFACPGCKGDGKCSECYGSGTNVHVNDSEPKCRNCQGSGICPSCHGSGSAVIHEPQILDPGLDKI